MVYKNHAMYLFKISISTIYFYCVLNINMVSNVNLVHQFQRVDRFISYIILFDLWRNHSSNVLCWDTSTNGIVKRKHIEKVSKITFFKIFIRMNFYYLDTSSFFNQIVSLFSHCMNDVPLILLCLMSLLITIFFLPIMIPPNPLLLLILIFMYLKTYIVLILLSLLWQHLLSLIFRCYNISYKSLLASYESKLHSGSSKSVYHFSVRGVFH